MGHKLTMGTTLWILCVIFVRYRVKWVWITQHIGAYQIEENGKKITFLDTLGHAALPLRGRGALLARYYDFLS